MERKFSEFTESNKSSINWCQFKDAVYHLCLAVITSWSLTLEASNDKYFLSLNFLNSMKTFR